MANKSIQLTLLKNLVSYVHMCVCVYIYIYREREGERERDWNYLSAQVTV